MAKLPDNPTTRLERYLARLAGQDVSIPDTPITRLECYLAYLIENGGGAAAPNAGAHNAIFRGKSLGSTFTEAQADAIDNGTFDDIFVGDYWPIGGVNYRVAGCDIFLNKGNPVFEKHHIIVVPDTRLYTAPFHSVSDISAVGYVNSDIKTNGLGNALTMFQAAFGSEHILARNAAYYDNMSATGPTHSVGVTTSVDLLSEGQVYGRGAWGVFVSNGFLEQDTFSQLPLFALAPQFIRIGLWYWLMDARSTTLACRVDGNGRTGYGDPAQSGPVRPYCLIGKAS